MEPSPLTDTHSLARLREIVRRLRGPDGCPWDARQTPESLVRYLLEESSELAEAIRSGSAPHACEELGDLLFIVVMLAECYEESSAFTFTDAQAGIVDKMIRRHPHVFSDAVVTDETQLRAQWNRIKAAEKKQSNP